MTIKMKTSFINQTNKKYDSKLTGKVSGQTLLFLGTGSIAQKQQPLLTRWT